MEQAPPPTPGAPATHSVGQGGQLASSTGVEWPLGSAPSLPWDLSPCSLAPARGCAPLHSWGTEAGDRGVAGRAQQAVPRTSVCPDAMTSGSRAQP